MNKSKIFLIIGIIVSIGILGVAIGFYVANRNNSQAPLTNLDQKISTASWLTYKNVKYGYQINHPQEWQVTGNEIANDVKFVQGSDEIISISVKENTKSLSSRDWILENISADDYLKQNLQDANYDNISGTKIIDYQETSLTLFFARERSIYEIQIYKEASPEIDEVIKSFQNTSQSEAKDLIYKVKAGQTLSEIAGKYNMTWPKLAKYNKLKSPYQVYAGQKLKIPKDPNALPNTDSKNSTNLELAREYQEMADTGKSVWRLDPVEVAKREIPPQKGITENDEFRIVSEDKLYGEVIIEITGKQLFEARLIQPIKKGSDGIWIVDWVKAK